MHLEDLERRIMRCGIRACVAAYEMLLRCGGNVIDIGRRQIAVVATAAVVLLMVSVYSLSLIHSIRHADDDWIQPTPIDHVLPRVGRQHHRPDSVKPRQPELPDEPHLPKKKVETRPNALKTTGGKAV